MRRAVLPAGGLHTRSLRATVQNSKETEMNKINLYAALVSLPLVLMGTAESFAWSKMGFAGTRDQVRAACTKSGGSITEGHNATHCFGAKGGNSVSCYDDGTCDGSGPGPMPRIRLGMLDTVGVLVGAARVQAPAAVPESLVSGSGGSGGGQAGAPGSSGWSANDVGQWYAQPSGGVFYAN